VASEDDPVAARIRGDGAAQHHCQFEAGTLPWNPDDAMAEAGIELLELFMPIGRGGERDSPVRMKMIDVLKRQQCVQWGVDGGGNRVHAKSAKRVETHHLVFVLDATIATGERFDLIEIKGRKALALDTADVTAATFDPKDGLKRAIERIGLFDLRTGVAAAEVGDAQ